MNPIEDEKLKDLLVRPGHISEADFELAQKEAKEKKEPLEDVLVEKELISDEHLGGLIAKELNYNFINLRKEKIDEEVLNLIPEIVAKSRGVIAFARTAEGLKVGMVNPDDLETRHIIEKRAGMKILPYFITQRGLKQALVNYKPRLKDEFENILNKLKNKSLAREERDGLTIQMVDMLLQYGYQNKASDVHIEPYEKKVVIRFRIDGVMHEVLNVPKELHELILMRIKILSKMRTDEHRSAQDGKLRFKAPEETVDVRVSVVPVTEGASTAVVALREIADTDISLEGLSESLIKNHQKVIEIEEDDEEIIDIMEGENEWAAVAHEAVESEVADAGIELPLTLQISETEDGGAEVRFHDASMPGAHSLSDDLRERMDALPELLDDALVGSDRFAMAFRTMAQQDAPLGPLLYKRGRRLPPLSTLPADFGRVLGCITDREAERAIVDWLRAAELADEDLAALDLRHGVADEARAFEVLRALCVCSTRPVVLCLDQIESIAGLVGADGVARMFTALMELYQQAPVAIVLMCQTQQWVELRRDVPQAAVDRIRVLPPMVAINCVSFSATGLPSPG